MTAQASATARFLETLREQRWDDHRYYHHSRINQSLHLISAISFLATYVLLFTHMVPAVLFGWTFSMCIRQVGHFFFEPKGYDEMNDASHAYKEQVKVGFNLRRKVLLHTAWAITPLLLLISPDLFGLFSVPYVGWSGFLEHLAKLWLVLAGVALVGRTLQLFFLRDVHTGLAWFTKILTDPFHDIMLYWRSPLALLRGELIEPTHGRERMA